MHINTRAIGLNMRLPYLRTLVSLNIRVQNIFETKKLQINQGAGFFCRSGLLKFTPVVWNIFETKNLQINQGVIFFCKSVLLKLLSIRSRAEYAPGTNSRGALPCNPGMYSVVTLVFTHEGYKQSYRFSEEEIQDLSFCSCHESQF